MNSLASLIAGWLGKPTGRVLFACLLGFLIAVCFKLHGSSLARWEHYFKDYPRAGSSVLLSTPKDVRTDEWEIWTPAVLSQAAQIPGFPITNRSLGAGDVPLIYNLPVRYYTTTFRPQHWGFFLFDIETAYSIYWNFKVFGLFISFFLLLRLLTRNHFWLSLLGSLWLFFSSYTQWWFSCPPMLPEMLATWALAIVCAVHIFRTDRIRGKLLWSLGLIFCLINFLLCLYPPFQIPLAYLGLFLVFALLREDCAGRNRQYWITGSLYLAGSLLIAGLLLLPFLQECLPTFHRLAETSYPGNRRRTGGGSSLLNIFSGCIDLLTKEDQFPEMFANVNVAANFFPLWPVGLGVWAVIVARTKVIRPVLVALLSIIVIFCSFALIRIPDWVCRASLLGFCTEERAIFIIGVANILFCVLVLHELQIHNIRIDRRSSWVILTVAGFLLTIYFIQARGLNSKFLNLGKLGLMFGLNLSLIALFLFAPPKFFGAGLVSILFYCNALVNPVASGLGSLLDSTPRKVVQRLVKEDPEAQWMVYQSNLVSEFLMSAGAPVLSGLKIVPNLEFYRRIDPEGVWKAVYNRYSFALFAPSKKEHAYVVSQGFPNHLVYISLTNPALRAENVHYVVLRQGVRSPEQEGLRPIAFFPKSEIFIYRLLPEP